LPTSKDKPAALRYLALGDSYTIGTGASGKAHNYPSIVAARLTRATGTKVGLTNPAVNGFTTQDLINNELGYVGRLKPQLVSILIGVNDLVQGRTPEQYRKSLMKINEAVAELKLAAGRVTLAHPDSDRPAGSRPTSFILVTFNTQRGLR